MRANGRNSAWIVVVLLFIFMVTNFADKAVIGIAAVDAGAATRPAPVRVGRFQFLLAVRGFVGRDRLSCQPGADALGAAGDGLHLGADPVSDDRLGRTRNTLVACRIALGAGEGPATPVALHSAYKWFPNELRTLPTAVIVQGRAIGVMVALPLLNWVIVRWTWHWAFGSLGLAGLVWCALWLVFGREGSLDDGSVKARDAARSSLRVGYAQLLLSPTILACWAASFGANWALSLALSWQGAYLIKGLGLAQSSIGFLEHWALAAARSRCLRPAGIRNACCRAACRADWRAAPSAG